jgi:hypothetical protein
MAEKTDSWQNTLSLHFVAMEKAKSELSKHLFGASHERAADHYEGACLDLLNHVNATYDSPEGFADFLKSETRHLVRAQNLSADEVDHMEWSVDQNNTISTAESVSKLYKENYSATIDNLAYIKQFRREEPLFPTP